MAATYDSSGNLISPTPYVTYLDPPKIGASIVNALTNALLYTDPNAKLAQNSNLSYVSGSLGIGTSTPSSYAALAVRSFVVANSKNVSTSISDGTNSTFDIRHLVSQVDMSAQNNDLTFSNVSAGTDGLERIRVIASTGAVSLKKSVITGYVSLAYSTSITPDASQGNFQSTTVTNATAFTINAPTNPPSATNAEDLTIEIFNNSGAAMGVVTWNAAFVFTNGAFTNPATGKKRHVRFLWNSLAWVETSRALADY